jgi:hypothetical protein
MNKYKKKSKKGVGAERQNDEDIRSEGHEQNKH